MCQRALILAGFWAFNFAGYETVFYGGFSVFFVFSWFSFVFFVFLSDFTPENSFHLRLFLPYLPSLSHRRGWQAFDCGYITLCITWNRWRLSNIVGTQTCNCRLSSETIRSMDQRAEHDYWIRLGWYIPMIPSWRFVFSISENLTP